MSMATSLPPAPTCTKCQKKWGMEYEMTVERVETGRFSRFHTHMHLVQVAATHGGPSEEVAPPPGPGGLTDRQTDGGADRRMAGAWLLPGGWVSGRDDLEQQDI